MRFLSAYEVESDKLYVYTENEFKEIENPGNWASDWVWQYAPDRETARNQHFDKLDEWEVDPTKHTY